MNNSDIFFDHVKKYQDERKRIVETFEKRQEELETAKGSQFYNDEMKKAKATKDSALSALKEEHGNTIFKSLEWMLNDAIKKPVVAPSVEQMNIINAVLMRKNLTRGEVNNIANSLADCPLALSLLQEKVNSLEMVGCHVGDYSKADVLSVDEVERIINNSKSSISDFLEYDTTLASRRARQKNENLYGTIDDSPLPKKPLITTKEECIETLLGVHSESVERFINTVD